MSFLSHKRFSFMFQRHRHRTQQSIHPDSQDNVSNARERLRLTLRFQNQEGEDPPEPPLQRQREEREVTCPICLANAQFAVETNCGHIFCGKFLGWYPPRGIFSMYYRLVQSDHLEDKCRQIVTVKYYKFLGNCMITYWRHGRWMGAIKCPVCRQVVSIYMCLPKYEMSTLEIIKIFYYI